MFTPHPDPVGRREDREEVGHQRADRDAEEVADAQPHAVACRQALQGDDDEDERDEGRDRRPAAGREVGDGNRGGREDPGRSRA